MGPLSSPQLRHPGEITERWGCLWLAPWDPQWTFFHYDVIGSKSGHYLEFITMVTQTDARETYRMWNNQRMAKFLCLRSLCIFKCVSFLILPSKYVIICNIAKGSTTPWGLTTIYAYIHPTPQCSIPFSSVANNWGQRSLVSFLHSCSFILISVAVIHWKGVYYLDETNVYEWTHLLSKTTWLTSSLRSSTNTPPCSLTSNPTRSREHAGIT